MMIKSFVLRGCPNSSLVMNEQKKAIVEVKEESEEETEVVLPDGVPLNTVAGVELPENAVGPALEFLEFSCAFYKVGLSLNVTRISDLLQVSFAQLPFHWLSMCVGNMLRCDHADHQRRILPCEV